MSKLTNYDNLSITNRGIVVAEHTKQRANNSFIIIIVFEANS